MLNKIIIMGRLTRDPEVRYTSTNKQVTSFSVACDRDYATGSEKTDFINCFAFGKTAEFVANYFSKGSMAVVDGRLQIGQYTDREGNKRTTAEVNAEHVYFGERKNSGSGTHKPVELTDEEAGELPF